MLAARQWQSGLLLAINAQREAIEETREALDELNNFYNEDRSKWKTTRDYIGCTFWIFVGIPLILTVLFVLLGGLGTLSMLLGR